jgi:DNA-binding transcriptional ArsR family regulator
MSLSILPCNMQPDFPSAGVFRAISSPTRRALLDKLSSRDQTVQRLASSFRMTLPAVSQQLAILRRAGLVTARRAGRWRVYRLNAEPLRDAMAWLQTYERFWVARLQALGHDLKGPRPEDAR